MDELGGFVGALMLGAVAIAAVFFVLWVIVAILMRVLAYLVLYWIITVTVAAFAGLIAGLLIPLRVLSGKAAVKPSIASPDKVVANQVMKIPPRGMQKHFGWDNAWPVYNPYQARLDALAVIAETRHLVRIVWSKSTPNSPASSSNTAKVGPAAKKASKTKKALGTVFASVPGLLWLAIAALPTIGFIAAVWVSIGMWLATMLMFGGITWVIQWLWVSLYRWIERGGRKHRRAELRCPYCYNVTDIPSYQCIGPGCNVVHRDISPGPLGMVRRRCACGHALPTTVGQAAKVLVAQCPYCDNPMSEGAGTRRTVQIPMIGTTAAGKTRLFVAGSAATEAHLGPRGGTVEPLTPQAADFMSMARDAMGSSRPTLQTPADKPIGLPFKLTLGAQVVELQMMDAGGETFKSMDRTQSLAYMDNSELLVLALDPLAFDAIREQGKRMGADRKVPITGGDQEDAYATVVDRLRSENVDLRKKSLAVVLTKADVLSMLPAGRDLDATTSDGVRQWLFNYEEDGFVRRIEDDFSKVTYFSIDSMGRLNPLDPRSPVRVIQWILDTANTKIAVIEPTATS